MSKGSIAEKTSKNSKVVQVQKKKQLKEENDSEDDNDDIDISIFKKVDKQSPINIQDLLFENYGHKISKKSITQVGDTIDLKKKYFGRKEDVFDFKNLYEFCVKYKIKMIVYDDKNNIIKQYIPNLKSKCYKNLIFMICDQKIYKCNEYIKKEISMDEEKLGFTIEQIVDLRKKIKSQIGQHVQRDIEKNNKTVLIDDLFLNKIKYENYHITFLNTYGFKYEYLIDDLRNKQVIDLNENDKLLLTYLLLNFGLVINLVHNPIIINKNQIDETFIEKYKDYRFVDISEEEILFLHEYLIYVDHKLQKIITDNTKNNIIKQVKENYNVIIGENDIRSVNMLSIAVDNFENIKDIFKMIKSRENIYITKRRNYNEYILNINYIDTNEAITQDDIIKLCNNMSCYCCSKKLDINMSNGYTIDAINPLLGHVKQNCDLLCKGCNSSKGSRYVGTYVDKPYYYDIESLDKDKLRVILKCHDLKYTGSKITLQKRLIDYLKIEEVIFGTVQNVRQVLENTNVFNEESEDEKPIKKKE